MWPAPVKAGVYSATVHDLAVTRVIALAAFIWTYFGLALGHLPGLRVDRTTR